MALTLEEVEYRERSQRSEIRGHPPSLKLRRGKEIRRQRSAAFAKASAFVKTSARQVGAPRRTEGRLVY